MFILYNADAFDDEGNNIGVCSKVTGIADGVDVAQEAAIVVPTGEPYWLIDNTPQPVPALWDIGDLGSPDGVGA
jgi:hypothetical protein